ncbi:MAG: type II toxin-antitoxin system MqsR family toxin [Giesbergeria sp.]|uniref:type II toxin-antitoxin system MqsR family toxin n=1 Tax=Giesbergeria sp. TaxID=2818473 RepID=UPI002614D333|nr:type II toxin-antitoxin system MqsR family toxin [Giesbergeria sp.]MDD2608225.1 type II toxin-antitoxin system MqsR family toxin [Giesbergeria sp.]
MEKNSPHYPLQDIKADVAARGADAFTRTALHGMGEMGLSLNEAVNMVLGLNRRRLVKSMTTHADHRVWQDVYHAPCPNGKMAYIKVTLQAGSTVIQFKEK